MKSIVILDRDGVINHDSPEYIKSIDEWQPIAGSCKAIAQLSSNGYKTAVATNQSGIGRKLYDEQTYREIEKNMLATVTKAGGSLDYVAFCPHTPEDNCSCRKPKAGMLYDIARHFNVSCEQCIFVGDSITDIEAAEVAGCQPVLVLTGNGRKTSHTFANRLRGIEIFPDLSSFVNNLIHGL